LDNTIPRRSTTFGMSKAELAIYEAMRIIEEMRADKRLTEAVIYLHKAREKVADFIDGIE
jgi:hypothetical protein